MVIAVDFDGTLVSDKFPEIGEPNLPLICRLKKLQSQGHYIVLWTSRMGDELGKAIAYCSKEHRLFFDAVNDRPDPDPDAKKYPAKPPLRRYGKIFADVYIDDRAVTPETFLHQFKEFWKRY